MFSNRRTLVFVAFFLVNLVTMNLVGMTASGSPPTIPQGPNGCRPRNLVLSNNDLTVLTTSLGSNVVIQMKFDGLTWIRKEIPIQGRSWGICLVNATNPNAEYAIVTMPFEAKIQVLYRFETGDFAPLTTYDAPIGCSEILADPAGGRCFVANHGKVPDNSWAPHIAEWQNAVYEVAVPNILGGGGGLSLTRAFVTDREPRALALSPDRTRLFVGSVQGALGGPSTDATAAQVGAVIPDAGSTISNPAYDGGSIIAFDLATGQSAPKFRVAVGSPVRGLAVLSLGETYRVYYDHLGYGAQAEDPDFGGDDIPNVISSFAVNASNHLPVASSRQDVYVDHDPQHFTISNGTRIPDTTPIAVLPEKLAIRSSTPPELWVSNSGSGTVTRLTLNSVTGRISTSGDQTFHFRAIDPVNTRTAKGWILATKVPMADQTIEHALGALTIKIGRSESWDFNDTDSSPFGILATTGRVLAVTQFDHQLVDINPGTGELQRSNLMSSSGEGGVNEDERDFFTFSLGFNFREEPNPQPPHQSIKSPVDNITCGSCHVDGHLDGKVRLIGNSRANRRVAGGVTNDLSGLIPLEIPNGFDFAKPVQVPSIFDVGNTEWLFHEGRKTVRDREGVADPAFCLFCQDAGFFFNTPAFTTDLKSPISPFAPTGRLSASQLRGRFLFEAMNCSRCHAGPTKNPQNGTASGGFFSRTNADPVTGFNLAGLETDVLGPLPNALQSFDNFLNDPTQIFLSFVSDEEEGHNMTDVGTRLTYEGDRNGINTPALANVWDNRPYMHDGRYRTLQEVLSNSWLSISEGYRAAPLAWGFIPDNAFNEPNGIPASEAALIAYNEPGTLYPFKTHEQYPAGSPPDPAVWARVTDYLTSIQGTNYPAGADPTADLTAFLDALSSQTILCGAEGDGAFLFSNVTVTPEAGQMRLSWNTVVPVPCEVTWGPVCNPNQTAPLTSRSTSHSVLLNAAQGMYKATIMAKMRTVCPDPARIEVTWGSESPIGTVTAPATTNLCPQGDMGNVVLQIDVQDGLYGSQISANRFSLCSQNDEGIVLYGSVHADGPANPPTLTTTMTITAGSGCDLSHPLTVLLDGTQVVGSVTTSLKSPDSAHPLGIVDMMDLEQFLPHYIAGGTYDACFDFNNNGTINVGDLGLLNAHMSHHTSGLMPTSQAAPGSARIACVEATRNAREIMVSLQAESKGKITSVLAVLDVPKGTKWEDDDSDRLAAWLDETQLVVVAWNPAGGGTIDLGSFQIPGGEIEAVQFIRGYVLEDGVSSSVAGMDYGSSPAGGIRLANLAPNPFRSSATLSFTLDAHEKVVVQAFDIGGRLVRTLQDGPLPAGAHDVVWDGRDSRGARLPAGIYFYRVSGEKSSITKKIVLLE